MKTKLINLLLSSPHGDAVRQGLGLEGDNVFTEILNFTIWPVSGKELNCDLRALIGKIAEDSTLSGEAVEVELQCIGARYISFANDDEHSDLEAMDAPLDIQTGDRLRILCARLEVTKVRAYNLGGEPR